jgi:outer membrane protein assembly factor BamB
VAGYAGPLVTGDRVFADFSDGHVVAYDAFDGTERWQPVDLSAEAEQASGDIPRYLDVDTTPVLGTVGSGEVIFVASYAGGI